MTPDEINQGNVVIAVFDGWVPVGLKRRGALPWIGKKEQAYKHRGLKGVYVFADFFTYDEDWGELKYVIDEIFTYALAYPEQVNKIKSMSVVVDRRAAYKAVLEFVNWYNTHKK